MKIASLPIKAIVGAQYVFAFFFVFLLMLVIAIFHPISTDKALKQAVWE